MNTQRIDGIKYNLETLSEDELVGIRGHLLEQNARIIGEIGLLDRELFDRTQPQIPNWHSGAY